MIDRLEASDEEPQPTWDDYARTLLLNPLIAAIFLLIFALLINIIIIHVQGGMDRIRSQVRDHAVAAEKIRVKRESDRQNEEWQRELEEQRRRSVDDNFAK